MRTLNFREKVYNIVRKIPLGKTMSYSEVAKLAGNQKAYRAVGNIVYNSPLDVPWHRVVSKPGKLAKNFCTRPNDLQVGQEGGIGKQKELLEKEGIKIKNGKVI